MAKIVLETSLGKDHETVFMYQWKVIDPSQLPDILEGECKPYRTDSDGALVYLPKEELEKLKKMIGIEQWITAKFRN